MSSADTTKSEYRVLHCVTAIASTYVFATKPACIALNPVNGLGRKMPVMFTTSPGPSERVRSPLTCTVSERGMCPTGTSSDISCTFTSWYLMNLDARVSRKSCGDEAAPRRLLQYEEGHLPMGLNVSPSTSWYTSYSQLSQVKHATSISGLTSPTRVQMPLNDTRWPMSAAFTLRIVRVVALPPGFRKTRNRRFRIRGSSRGASPESSASGLACSRWRVSTSNESSSTTPYERSGMRSSAVSANREMYRRELDCTSCVKEESAASDEQCSSRSDRSTSSVSRCLSAISCSMFRYLNPSPAGLWNERRNAAHFSARWAGARGWGIRESRAGRNNGVRVSEIWCVRQARRPDVETRCAARTFLRLVVGIRRHDSRVLHRLGRERVARALEARDFLK